MADLARDLAAAEGELAQHRARLAATVAWINDPTRDESPRRDLARHLGLPEPRRTLTLPTTAQEGAAHGH